MQTHSNGLSNTINGGAAWKHILGISPLLLLLELFGKISPEQIGQLIQQAAQVVHQNQLLIVTGFVCLTMREMIRALVEIAK